MRYAYSRSHFATRCIHRVAFIDDKGRPRPRCSIGRPIIDPQEVGRADRTAGDRLCYRCFPVPKDRP